MKKLLVACTQTVAVENYLDFPWQPGHLHGPDSNGKVKHCEAHSSPMTKTMGRINPGDLFGLRSSWRHVGGGALLPVGRAPPFLSADLMAFARVAPAVACRGRADRLRVLSSNPGRAESLASARRPWPRAASPDYVELHLVTLPMECFGVFGCWNAWRIFSKRLLPVSCRRERRG